MTWFAEQSGVLFAAAGSERAIRAIELDWPQHPWQWALYGGCLAMAVALAVLIYVRDTADLSGWWRAWLTMLRLLVIAALVIIGLNPQERTQKMSYRPSRVSILVDTSLSMRYPQTSASTTSTPQAESTLTRSGAAAGLLGHSSLLNKLRREHEVSIYTFDSTLAGPQHVFPKEGAMPIPQTPGTTGATSAPNMAGAAAQPGTSGQSAGVDWDEMLRPQGVETRLGESLAELIRQTSGRTLSGIVVISDGASNAGVEPATANEVAKASKTRLFSVGVGSTEQPVNVRVVNIQGPTDVHVGDDYEISAFVQGQGMAGKDVEVELLTRPEGEDAKPFPAEATPRRVKLLEDGIPVEVKFRQTPSVAGGVEFFVRVRPAAQVRELTLDDNERRKSVNVVDRKTRVLIVAGGPMRDYRFVRNMLYRHKAITSDVWLQSVDPAHAAAVSQESNKLLLDFPATAAELFEYDVVICFDIDWKRIPAERLGFLSDWVSKHSGGLILIAGDVYTPQLAGATEELKPVLELYPVFLSAYLLQFQFDKESDQPWPIAFTREGRDAGFLQLTDSQASSVDAWKSFPGIYRCYPTAGAKAGATVYANFSDPRAQTENGQPILLASQFYGAGRTMYLGSAEMWRLRAAGDEYYDRFWTKTIREVAQGRLKRGTSRGLMMLERDQYVLGQTVHVRVSLMNPQLEPFVADSVAVEIFDPSGRPLVPARRLVRDESRLGQFVGDFRAGVPGTYRIEVPVPESTDQVASKIDVVVPNLESDNPRQNARLLSDLVRDTGGRYLQLDEAEAQLPALLPNQGEEFLIDERLRTLWDRQWVLLALAGFLGAEWLTRKLLKLA